jgi:hypothetical protein
MQAVGSRLAEYNADQAAVAAGHRAGLRLALARIGSLDGPRNGWEQAVCATHPPTEIRLQRIEDPGHPYPLQMAAAEADIPEDGLPVVMPPSPPNHVFMKPRTITGAGYFGITMVLILATAIWGAIFIVQQHSYSPEAALRNYSNALAKRDVEAALSNLGPGFTSQLDSSFLQSLISSPKYQPPTDLQIQSILESKSETNTRTREASLNLRIDTQEYATTLQVLRDHKRTAVLFYKWWLQGGINTLTINAPPATPLQINDVAINSHDESTQELTLLFGRYSVGVAENPLLEMKDRTFDLVSEPVQLSLEPTIRDSALRSIDAQVKAYIDDCSASSDAIPEGCPLSYNSYGFYDALDSVEWSIRKYPVTTTFLDPEQGLVKVQTETNGIAEIKFSGSEPTYRDTVSFSVSGEAVSKNNEVVFVPENLT